MFVSQNVELAVVRASDAKFHMYNKEELSAVIARLDKDAIDAPATGTGPKPYKA
jgi:hypothetical protein